MKKTGGKPTGTGKPPKNKRRNPLEPGKRRFLAAFAQCGSITEAAKQAGIHSASHYRWLKAKNNAVYAKAFKHAWDTRLKAFDKALEKSFDLFDRTDEVDALLAKYVPKGMLKLMAELGALCKRIDEGTVTGQELRDGLDCIWPQN